VASSGYALALLAVLRATTSWFSPVSSEKYAILVPSGTTPANVVHAWGRVRCGRSFFRGDRHDVARKSNARARRTATASRSGSICCADESLPRLAKIPTDSTSAYVTPGGRIEKVQGSPLL